METNEAIRVVAQHAIWAAVEDRIGQMWEMYPEVGEHDWSRITQEFVTMLAEGVGHPDRGEFDVAYAHLAERTT